MLSSWTSGRFWARYGAFVAYHTGLEALWMAPVRSWLMVKTTHLSRAQRARARLM